MTDDAVAIKYYQTVPHVLRMGDGTEYAFVVRARVSMAWIAAQHVDTVLSMTKMCCGGNKKTVYRRCNEDDIRRWTNGGGR